MSAASDILDPIFLRTAGNQGFYGDKEALAVCVSLLMSAVHYCIAVFLSRRRTDLSA